jgi:hypothetical protein
MVILPPMANEPHQVTDHILTAMRNEHRTDMRVLASNMAGLTRAMEAMREQMRDVQGRLNDVIALQVTKGDLEAIHFELNRFVERLEAIEPPAPAE